MDERHIGGRKTVRTRQERSEFRAFVRAHHPDRGGDPDVFARGLARLRGAQNSACSGDRFDGPVVVVARQRGIRALVSRVRAWRARRTRSRVR